MKPSFILSILLAVGMTAAAQTPWNGSVAEAYDGGDGTPGNPYQIATAEQLALLAQQTNDSIGGDACYLLTNDIFLNDGDSLLWTPIGETGTFTGVFDGDKHFISGLYVDGLKFSGLFGYAENATIKNTSLENATITVYEQPLVYLAIGGILVGKAKNTNIMDCSVDGSIGVLSTKACGGIVGMYDVDLEEQDTVFIKNCVNNAEVIDNVRIGGMAGQTNVSNGYLVIENCINYGELWGFSFCGGMVGEGEFIIRNCDNYGEIYSEGCSGGMAGQGGSFNSITNSINHESGKVTGEVAGGIIGTAIYTVMTCCANKTLVTGYSDNEICDELLVGGISGADGTIYNCYNRGDVMAIFTCEEPLLIQMGGISGTPVFDQYIRNVYNTGTIIKPSNPDIPNAWYGHIVPATSSDTLLGNCYWMGNETFSPYIYNVEAGGWTLIPGSSVFGPGATPTTWVLEEAQYGTNDLLAALNAGVMGQCTWAEDVDGENDGLPVFGPLDPNRVDEITETPFHVYPNPTNGVLYVETFPETSPHGTFALSETFQETSLPSQTYRVTNLMGQTLKSGNLTGDRQQLDVSALPAGMYLLAIDNATVKFIVK